MSETKRETYIRRIENALKNDGTEITHEIIFTEGAAKEVLELLKEQPEPKVIACGSGELDVEESDLALDGHALMKAFYDTPEGLQTWSYAWYLFNHAKLAKPKRKRGDWIPQDYNKRNGYATTTVYYYPKCSVCGNNGDYTMRYCPNCGADMRGGSNGKNT